MRLFTFSSLLLLSVGTPLLTHAQQISFDFADPQPNIIEVYGGSFASGDIDGDGDADLLIAGQDPGRETALYLNDGQGNFAEVLDVPFPATSSPQIFFEDLDGDGDLDLFFAGSGFSIGAFAHTYLNDGQGHFTLLNNPAIPGFIYRGAAISDVDNDDDLDILLSIENANGTLFADIFLNDGNANFSAQGDDIITPLQYASIEFFDADGDGDADVILSGEQENGSGAVHLYRNDGQGNFALDAANSFLQIKSETTKAADLDNDGDLDLLMSGLNDAFYRKPWSMSMTGTVFLRHWKTQASSVPLQVPTPLQTLTMMVIWIF
ncbi:MAG: FG-GAP-like repeat-containing protein [Saprospiraceae bacterium]